MIWPLKKEFPISENESLICRDGDVLYFSRWIEDPYYQEYVCLLYTSKIIMIAVAKDCDHIGFIELITDSFKGVGVKHIRNIRYNDQNLTGCRGSREDGCRICHSEFAHGGLYFSKSLRVDPGIFCKSAGDC